MTGQREAIERQLLQDPALCERILRELPPVAERERIVIRAADTASVGPAILRALAVAAGGTEVRIESLGGKKCKLKP